MRLLSIQKRKEGEELDLAVVTFAHTHVPSSGKTHYIFAALLPLFNYEAYKDFESGNWYRGWKAVRFGVSYYGKVQIGFWVRPIGNRVLLFTREQIEDRGYL